VSNGDKECHNMDNYHTHHTYHTWIEISKKAIDHNIAQYKKLVGNKIIAPVIKGNAYGHGIVEIGRICEKNKAIEWLCVANLSEALALRKNGIKKPILVLSYLGPLTPSNIKNLEIAALQNISLVVYDRGTVNYLSALGKNIGKSFHVHIKIDTGLSRLGVDAHRAVDFVKYVRNLKRVTVEGIWTHFAESPSEDRSFTDMQAHKFLQVIKDLETMGITIPIIHSCNSSGISTVNLSCDNFFRLGIGLYGYWASEYIKKITQDIYPDFTLQPTLTWKSKISCIKNISKQSFVGYDRTYQAKRDSRIAVISVGYYDGYDRRLSNNGRVIINGQIAPIIGIVCMNVFTVDVTEIKNINVGDEVILIGNTNGVQVSEIAKLGNLNPREITTKINPNTPRVIVD